MLAGIETGANDGDQNYARQYITISEAVKPYFLILCAIIQILAGRPGCDVVITDRANFQSLLTGIEVAVALHSPFGV